MRFLHVADLHLGKSIYGIQLAESGDQATWVDRFLALCERERPDALVVAGDVYDRSVPNVCAVNLLDRMLTRLCELGIPTLMIAGNHDGADRLAFCGDILARSSLHIAGTPRRKLEHVTFDDPGGHGPVTFWLMPYLFPEQVGALLGIEGRLTYDEAARRLLAEQDVDFSQRNVLVAHQNVVADGREVERGGSETMVGGVGEIDYTAFDGFDYVALGHIHSSYPVGRPAVRYAGTPLCYHFSETRQPRKGPLMVELGPKGTEPTVTLEEIEPLHRMRALKGTYDEVERAIREEVGHGEYVGVTLTDRRVTPQTAAHLRELVENRDGRLLEQVSTYREYADPTEAPAARDVRERALEDLFSDLFGERCGEPPTDEEYDLMRYAAECVRGSDPHERLDDKLVDRLLDHALATLGGEDR